MSWVNEINSAFEAVGAILAWRNASAASRVRPAGVDPALIAFSGLWAVWCVPYYLAHQDTSSAVLASARCAGCLVWCWHAWSWRLT